MIESIRDCKLGPVFILASGKEGLLFIKRLTTYYIVTAPRCTRISSPV